MKISIVTVVFNGERTIEDALRSVAMQSHPDIEHIVVDGASTDGTMDVVRRHSRSVTKVISERDRGLYDAMNKGVGLATGDVVGFLNADDFYAHANVLAQVARTMADPAVDGCYADLVYVDPEDTGRIVRYWRSRPYEHGLARRGWLPAHPTFFLRRTIYREVGGFDLEFPRQADFEMALRLFEIRKIRAAYVPEVWVRMRAGGISNSNMSGVIKGNIEAYRACRKNGFKVTPFFMVRKILSRVPQFFSRPQSGGVP